MQRKNLLSFAALSASFLLPVSGAYADQNDTGASKDSTTSMSKGMNEAGLGNAVMDAGQYRDTLHNIRDLLSQIRENDQLAIAAPDSLTQAQYQSDNRVLATQVLGLLNSVTRNWKHSEIPSMGNETAEMRSNRSEERMGSADMQRYAIESPDTAIVRNAVWEIQSDLQGDKLNGRDPNVSKHTLKLLDMAISHAENPSFKMEKAASQDQQESSKETTKTEESTSSSQQLTTPAPEQPVTPPAPEQTTPAPEQPATPPASDQAAPAPEQPASPPAPEQTTPAPEQPATPPTSEQATPAPEQPSVAPTPEQTTPAPEPPTASPETPTNDTNAAPTTTDNTGIDNTTDNTTTDRSGAANLPQTGGDPGLVVLLGSSLMGLGAFLRRRG